MDVYRLTEAMIVANRSAAAALVDHREPRRLIGGVPGAGPDGGHEAARSCSRHPPTSSPPRFTLTGEHRAGDAG